jgi:hypothetical protein
VIAVVPAATPVPNPASLTVATDWVDDAQVTEDERFAVDPSL